MLSKYEIIKYRSYIINPIKKNIRSSCMRNRLQNWINENGDKLSLNNLIKNKENFSSSDVYNFVSKISTKKQKLSYDAIDKNLSFLGDLIGLNALEKELIGLFIRYSKHSFFEDFCDFIFGYNSWVLPTNIALCLSVPENQILSIIRPDGLLRKFDIISSDSYRHRLEVSEWVYNLINAKINSLQDMISLIVGNHLNTPLTINDFEYIPQREQIKELTKKALTCNMRGVNILLYGIPGTGKTEFAKVLAKEIGCQIYSIGEKNKAQYTDVLSDRFYQLVLANEALKNDLNSILLFDEAEDIFSHSPFQDKPRVSKIALNRLLENNYRPTIWTTNDIIGIDEAYLRRFSYIISFKTPPNQIKTTIWEKKFQEYNISYNKEIILSLSKEYEIPPAFIDNVVRSMFLMNGSIESLKKHLNEIEMAKNGGVNKQKIGFF